MYVGTFLLEEQIKKARELCSIPPAVAILWVQANCMTVMPKNATTWLEPNITAAIIIQNREIK